MKRIVVDLDGTLTHDESEVGYLEKKPRIEVVEKLKYFHSQGYEIAVFTARNMRTYSGNIGLINVYTLPNIIEWLKKYEVPFNEIIVGKPWCGDEGFYVDDRAIRPDEFAALDPTQIAALLKNPAN